MFRQSRKQSKMVAAMQVMQKRVAEMATAAMVLVDQSFIYFRGGHTVIAVYAVIKSRVMTVSRGSPSFFAA